MGIQKSFPNFEQQLLRQNWSQIPSNQIISHPNYGNFKRLCNNMTRQLLDQFTLYFNLYQQYQNYQNMFKFRQHQQNLVNAKFLVLQQEKSLCSITYHAKIYIQNIAVRLSEIKDIPFPQNLYILEACFKGFSILFNRIGYFKVHQNLVCMNQQGIVKVWLNSDFSKNYTAVNYCPLPSQKLMILQIVQLIDNNIDKQTQTSSIKEYILQNSNNLNFFKATQLLQSYALENQITIPKYFQTIVDKIREDRGIQLSSNSQIIYNSGIKNQINNFIRQSRVCRMMKNSSLSAFKSQSSKTYADQLKAFDSNLDYHLVNKKTTIQTDRIQKSKFNDIQKIQEGQCQLQQKQVQKIYYPTIEDKIQQEKKDVISTVVKVNHGFQRISEQEKTRIPTITFTYKDKKIENKEEQKQQKQIYQQIQKKKSQIKIQVKQQSDRQQNMPISPITKESVIDKNYKQNLIYDFELDPQIAADLIKYVS